MRFYYFTLLFIISLIFTTCKDDDTQKTDNLYEYKDYISYHTNGRHSVAAPIKIKLNKQVAQYELSQEIPSNLIAISPEINGKLYIENGNTLLFQPKENLKPDTKYILSINLKELYGNLPKGLEKYTFSFKTIAPNFKIETGNLQSYSKEKQYLFGEIETADVINLIQAKQLLIAKQDGKTLPISWGNNAATSTIFHFKIDSISRKKQEDQILLSWNGKPIGAEHKGKRNFKIAGQDNFKIVDIHSRLDEEASLAINFSDPINPQQDFQGLVNIENQKNLRFEVDNNVLHVYPKKRVTGKLKVEVFSGLQNLQGATLQQNFSELIGFQELKPAVRMLSKGVILPASANTPLHFETVNLRAVDVRIIKIYQDNILSLLQTSNLYNTYNIRRVGRKIAQKTILLENTNSLNTGNWQAHAINLSNFIKADPGAVYQVEISFRKNYSTYKCGNQEKNEQKPIVQAKKAYPNEQYREEQYWNNELYDWRQTPYNWQEKDNPCHASYYQEDRFARTNILGSDLGLLVKESDKNTYHVITTNLLKGNREIGVKISLYDFQKQLIKKATTKQEGIAKVTTNRKAAFIIAKKGNNYAYAELDGGNALSLSKFDVSGQELQRGLKGFLYTERGVHRPGDSIHLTFVLNDKENPIPQEHPIQLSVTDARGRLVLEENLRETKHSKQAKNGFYYFPIATKQNDPTGNWEAKISVGGANFSKTLKVATVKPNRLKINLDFDQEILKAEEIINGDLSAKWLHGAPARNLKAAIDVELSPVPNAFPDYQNYIFTDPVRSFESVENKFLETQLSQNGKVNFQKTIPLNTKAPGMLQANFLTKVFEGGGDFSIDVISKKLAPYPYFVGLKAPETKKYGSYNTDEDIKFSVISLNDEAKPAANRNLKIYAYKIEWRWWWNRGKDNLSRYENAEVHRAVKKTEVTTNSNGKATFSLNIPEREAGRYLIRIVDEASGHATGKLTYFYEDWYKNPSDGQAESAKMLVFSADKKEYQVGEEAVITFPSGENAHALISIENGSKVLSQEWVETKKGETQVKIPLSKEMAPNIYVNITLLQPHAQTKNDLPIRLYGVIPILVENPQTKLQPQLHLPKTLKPEQNYSVKVSEKNNRAMTYTLAVVDEGLLDLTRFKTPAIHQAFYAREALGVKTFDIYDDVIGALTGSVDNIYEIGGGDLAAGAKNRKAERFKPVVSYLGPFYLEAGKTATHQLYMPNYVGSVRAMLVAGNEVDAAYGNAEKAISVKKPLMVLTSLPRKLSPGEKVTLPVTVFAMEKKIKTVQVKVKTDAALTPLTETTQNIHFNEVGEQIINFEFDVKAATKPQNIQVFASGAGEKAKSFVEIDVVNPNPVSHKSQTKALKNQENANFSFTPFGVSGSNSANLVVSTLPPIDLEKRLDFLIDYPHGCLEQIISGAFPQLYLNDLAEITYDKKQEIKANIESTLQKLSDYQLASGGFSYWPGGNSPNDWSTTYAGHFMLEAKQKGYVLPVSLLSNWLSHQKRKAQQWRNSYTSYNSSLNQAYRLYTLALAGQPELAAMNRLRESNEMNPAAKWRLAAAYAQIGKKDIANNLRSKTNTDFNESKNNRFTYGSAFRNKAMALETLVLLEDKDQLELAQSLAKGLSSQKWYSTQEAAYALLALSKMAVKQDEKAINVSYVLNGKEFNAKTDKNLVSKKLNLKTGKNKLNLTNHNNQMVFVTLTQSGKLPVGEELQEQRNLQVKTQFADAKDKILNIKNLRQGTEITAKITITNTGLDVIKDVALTQIFPSGWEIVNTGFTNFGNEQNTNYTYKDIRDDRVNFYFDLDKKQTKTFRVKLNASYLGNYYLPGTQAEAMYDNNYFARNNGVWVKVIE